MDFLNTAKGFQLVDDHLHVVAVVHTQIDFAIEDILVGLERQHLHVDVQLMGDYLRQVVEQSQAVDATKDDVRIENAVKSFGGRVVMTSTSHRSGTDRCYEAFTKIPGDFDVVIKCDVCGGTVLANDAITKLIKPGVYLPLPLDIFEMALKYENEHPEEEESE